MFSPAMLSLLGRGILETLYMTLASTALAYTLGLPLGVALTITQQGGLRPMKTVHGVLDTAVNIFRSPPFLILLIALIPMTRAIVGTSIGSTATVVPLVVAAIPFIGRMVEGSLNQVDDGLVEAALSMGAGVWQIITGVLLRESLPSLIHGAAIAATTILSYSAMAGAVGGGGLGAIAISYGYNRYQTGVMMVTLALLVIIVQLIQWLGSFLSRRLDKKRI